MPDAFTGYAFHIDHIVAIKHGGDSNPENLAYCCALCNINKGTDFGTFVQFGVTKTKIVRFFNPRIDVWFDHFILEKGYILPKTKIGTATIKILDFNNSYDADFREILTAQGLFP
jgi:hypothetical protein